MSELDFAAHQRKADRKAAERVKARIPEIRRVAQAGVALEKLTKNKDWHYYLSLLTKLKEDAEAGLKSAEEGLHHPDVWDPVEIARLKARVLSWRAHIQALGQAIELPRLIEEHGKGAAEILRKDAARES